MQNVLYFYHTHKSTCESSTISVFSGAVEPAGSVASPAGTDLAESSRRLAVAELCKNGQWYHHLLHVSFYFFNFFICLTFNLPGKSHWDKKKKKNFFQGSPNQEAAKLQRLISTIEIKS